MTFLNYVCWKPLGDPLKVNSQAEEAYWPCPYCDAGNPKSKKSGRDNRPKFHTRPVSHRYPSDGQKFSCYHCGEWGDAMDLIAYLYPEEDKPQHAIRWRVLREDWESSYDDQPLLATIGQNRRKSYGNEHCEYDHGSTAKNEGQRRGQGGQGREDTHSGTSETEPEQSIDTNSLTKEQRLLLRKARLISLRLECDLTRLADQVEEENKRSLRQIVRDQQQRNLLRNGRPSNGRNN